jgi:choloylglycine hydrolase
MKKWIVALTLVSFFHTSYACTAVNIKAVDGTVIAGRTMEWAFDMKWTINSIPQGTKFRTAASDPIYYQIRSARGITGCHSRKPCPIRRTK